MKATLLGCLALAVVLGLWPGGLGSVMCQNRRAREAYYGPGG